MSEDTCYYATRCDALTVKQNIEPLCWNKEDSKFFKLWWLRKRRVPKLYKQPPYYLYGLIVKPILWVFVNDKKTCKNEIAITAVNLSTFFHYPSRLVLHNSTSPITDKICVRLLLEEDKEKCEHINNTVDMYFSSSLFDFTSDIIEYLKYYLYERKEYLDYNNEKVLKKVILDCLELHDVLVSPCFLRLFIKYYREVQEFNKISCCDDTIYCESNDLIRAHLLNVSAD